jgi:hypothetical protein
MEQVGEKSMVLPKMVSEARIRIEAAESESMESAKEQLRMLRSTVLQKRKQPKMLKLGWRSQKDQFPSGGSSGEGECRRKVRGEQEMPGEYLLASLARRWIEVGR